MVIIENQTPFATVDFCAVDKRGQGLVVTCVCGTFCLPEPDRLSLAPLELADTQEPPPLADRFVGEPGKSSLREAGQAVYGRPGTDITFEGSAWAPAERPVDSMLVRVRVGNHLRGVHVFGERVWTRGIFGLAASAPRPFVSMELTYERSFGGVAPNGLLFDEHNPVGRGFGGARDNDLLPNLENATGRGPDAGGRGPAGLGPIASHWRDRAKFAGSYDETWIRERAPLWPRDLDLRFFCAAPPGMTATPWLVGGEEVVIAGASPRGTYQFTLPRYALVGVVLIRGRPRRSLLRLDAVHFQTDLGKVKLYWRMAMPFEASVSEHELTTIRPRKSWEVA